MNKEKHNDSICREASIAVVIPCLNASDFVVEAIDSALHQSLSPQEILVVDDGSTDGTLQLLKRLYGDDDRIKILQHVDGRNEGVFRSRRLGVMQASSQNIAFLDADDVFENDKLLRQAEIMQSHPAAILVHSDAAVFGGRAAVIDTDTRFSKFDALRNYDYFEQPEFLYRNGICNSSVLLRKAYLLPLYERLNFPQLFQYEDWLLWVLLGFEGPFVYTPDLLVRYRLHDASATAKVDREALRAHYSYIELLMQIIGCLAERDYVAIRPVLAARLGDRFNRLARSYGGRELNVAESRIAALLGGEGASLMEDLQVMEAERRRLLRLVEKYERSTAFKIIRRFQRIVNKAVCDHN